MKRMLTGIKPTGKLTLGNYIGAIKPCLNYQDDYEMFIFIANQHAITINIDPKELKQNTDVYKRQALSCTLVRQFPRLITVEL